MKFLLNALPLLSLGTALVIPLEQTLSDLVHGKFEALKDEFTFTRSGKQIPTDDSKYNPTPCEGIDIDDTDGFEWDTFAEDGFEPPKPPKPPKHPKPPKKPHHPHHPHHPGKGKSNKTIYELIKAHSQVSKFAELVDKYDDLKKILNQTDQDITVFVPTNKAFEKIPKSFDPSDDFLHLLAKYHVVPESASAGNILTRHTLPTFAEGDGLSSDPEKTPQRLSAKLSLRGLQLNGYVRVIYANGRASNGIIHAVDKVVFPPPPAAKVIDLFPQYFSTLQLALIKTGFYDQEHPHLGATFFAPPNSAWQKLGPALNGFLFSDKGLKYLRYITQYHIHLNSTLYSDNYYSNSDSSASSEIPKGRYHANLPTLLKDRSLSIDIARWGGLIDMVINAYTRVGYQDTPSNDGVLHIVENVLIPPKQLNGKEIHYQGGSMTVEELKARIDPYLDEDETSDEVFKIQEGVEL